jgi:acyl-[acyl-carrier-protein]-phospholipid O-acyltransferase/long-chain-fatty-acid--[acyl-carrier-protein] ligase
MINSTRRNGFKALLGTQFLGAFNDNAFKLVISFFAVDHLITSTSGTFYLSLSGAIFILPFLVFSTYAGYLADKYSKQAIIVGAKVAELMVMFLGFLALLTGNIWPLLIVLFFMGMQSAFFSPSKYGILPEILRKDDLSAGNGLIQMWTYAAIILGQAAGGFLVHVTTPLLYKTSYTFMVISLIGIVISLFVTKVPPSGAQRPFKTNFIREILSHIQEIRKNRPVFLCILGLTYFGFLSGLFQLNILLYARKLMQLNHLMSSSLLALLALGIGAGSFLAGRCSDQKVELGIVPIGAIGLSLFTVILGFVHTSYMLVAVCLFVLGISCGFYIIPLHALIQGQSPKDKRGQVLAVNNFLSFSGIFLGFVSLFFLRDILGLNAAEIFVFTGILTVLGTGYICRLLPFALLRFIVWTLTHTLYSIKKINTDKIPKEGGALLVSNHVSYVDALVLVVCVERPIRFLVHRDIYQLRPLRPILRLAKAIPIAGSDRPREMVTALSEARAAIDNGELVCIFPEGRLTRTGNMHKFHKGCERIIRDSGCPVIPMYLDRIWGSIFSYEGGQYFTKMPKMIPYPITLLVGDLLPSNITAYRVREQVRELGAEAFAHRETSRRTLPEAFWREARKHPFRFCVADSSKRKLNYAETLISAICVARSLKERLRAQANVGIMIPPSVGGVIVNLAVTFLNKVPVNLNYTASPATLDSIAQQCSMRYVITSRRFLEKIQIKVPGELIFVEDVIAGLTRKDRILAMIYAFGLPASVTLGRTGGRHRDQVATLMFTSGSTGEPKGVMLTHANITSNLEGLYQVFRVQGNDKILGILPFFHSFGFTATIWFPLISGMGAVYHANPLDARMVGALVKQHRATLLMATPTFLNAYTRRCQAEDLASLRIVIVGAEKLKQQIARAFKEKFGTEPMEGYGCTELSPIVSINLPDIEDRTARIVQQMHKPGKIGLPLPNVAVRVIDQETGRSLGPNENGLLLVKGPNVMKGYLHQDEKTATVMRNGWYVTGDVANIDEDGFITITDRVSRFSKIAGEMVPHIKVEEKIHALLNAQEQVCVVTSVEDAKKGEKLVVLCLRGLDIPSIVEELKQSDLPNLWVPGIENFYAVDAIPLLGTGKLDLGRVKKIAQEREQEKHDQRNSS